MAPLPYLGGQREGVGVGELGAGLAGAVDVEPDVVPCCVRTLSNMVRAASTQARMDSRSSQRTAIRASPLRRTKRAARECPR